ncbi:MULTISPECIES: META domain-containing protein [unclassified Acinetobacter]|uniref:META domain-containing protein n=1 Tax=unclassified Acinetobacter TaxID=196816 RepID=UPI0015D38BFB|nr:MULTISPECIES: META domain-containing protein [unclassified Acinetobacter]UIJ76289.1 META domain-containing protein [Acinetobacter sp. SH20PTE14]
MPKKQQICQNNLKLLIKYCIWGSFLISCLGLMACQSSPTQTVTTKSQGKSYGSSVEQPLKVIRVNDGIQDIPWTIVKIAGQKAKFFHHQPYLQFNSQFRQIQGNTGCNTISGTYVIDTLKHSVDLNARAGYFSCDSALAQEAELSDALQAATQFQIKGKQMTMQNSLGKTVLVLERK